MKRRVYLDTSAYLASLINEARAGAVRKAVDRAAVFSSVLLVAETKRTLVRLSREGSLSMPSYVRLMQQVDDDSSTFALAPTTLELCASHVMPTITTPRTLDLIHLRTALWFHEQHELTAFLSLDANQNRAAADLGLPVATIA
ncbi:MAG: type II toxin-antitoxin system VapC family toxin [Planctomycetes bacterium]|nr:type II toxin-antitoxin system VapC family toxin [Planctomycetota bacterium]